MKPMASKPKIVSLFLALTIVATALCVHVPVSEVQAGFIEPFAQAELFFEENTTDEDLGLHFNLDARSWRRVLILAPDFSILVNLSDKENLRQIGLTQVQAESAEPGHIVIPRQDFLDLFPEGVYLFVGVTTDGDFLLSETLLTHRIPEGATLVSPEEDAEVNAGSDLIVEWETVPDPDPPGSVIEFYEVVVEKDEPEERVRVFKAEMLPTDNRLRVPREFLEAGKNYKVEIISQETSGNRSSIEVPFSTLP